MDLILFAISLHTVRPSCDDILCFNDVDGEFEGKGHLKVAGFLFFLFFPMLLDAALLSGAIPWFHIDTPAVLHLTIFKV